MGIAEHLDGLDLNKPVSIINPSAEDFSMTVVDKKGQKIEYTVKSRESLQLPYYAAQHVSRKLMGKILSKKTGVVTRKMKEDTLKQIRMYE
jgi:hypothetical protein